MTLACPSTIVHSVFAPIFLAHIRHKFLSCGGAVVVGDLLFRLQVEGKPVSPFFQCGTGSIIVVFSCKWKPVGDSGSGKGGDAGHFDSLDYLELCQWSNWSY